MHQKVYQQREVKVLLKIAFASVKAVAAIYMILVMFPNIPVFTDKLMGSSNAPGLYLLQMILGALLLVLTLKHYRNYLSLTFLHWTIALFAIYFWTLIRVKYFLTDSTADDIAHAIDRIERALLIPMFLVVMANCSRKRIQRIFILAIVLVPIPIILNFFYPEWFVSSVAARAAGTYINANQAGEAVLLWLFIVYQRLPRFLVIPFYLLAGVAVILTFSRSGMLAWALVGMYLIFVNRISRWMVIVPLLVVTSYSTILINAEDWLSKYIDNEVQVTQLVERLDIFGKLGSGMGEAIDDGSRRGREAIAEHTLEEIWKRPFLGYGYEVERNLGINAHNMPLQVWYTYGIFGLALYLWLGFLLFKAGRQQGYGYVSPFFLIFVWFSLFDHAHITDNYWLIVYAYLCRRLRYNSSVSKAKVGYSTTSKSKTERQKRSKSRRKSSGKTIHDFSKTLLRKGTAKSRSRRKKILEDKSVNSAFEEMIGPRRRQSGSDRKRRSNHRSRRGGNSSSRGSPSD